MKEKDLHVDFKEQQMILYAEKEDQTYGPTQTGSYMSKNYLDDFQLKQRHLEENSASKVLEGQHSLLYYYMLLEDITVVELAARVGLRKSVVERHLTVDGLLKARVKHIVKYAGVFNIPVANLFQLISTRNDKNWKSHYVDREELQQGLCIDQQKTANPLVVKTFIESTPL